MNNAEIGNLVDVSTLAVSGTEYSLAKDLATDILEGCYEEYLFFCNGLEELSATQDSTQYILLVGSLSRDNQNYYVCSDCRVYQIFVVTDTSDDVKYYVTYYTYTRDTVRVSSQVSTVFYSSLDYHPQLIDGGEFYGFATNCMLVIGFVFMLLSRVFRRVS